MTISRTIGGGPAYAVIVEAQQRHDKRWPVYVATLRARAPTPHTLSL